MRLMDPRSLPLSESWLYGRIRRRSQFAIGRTTGPPTSAAPVSPPAGRRTPGGRSRPGSAEQLVQIVLRRTDQLVERARGRRLVRAPPEEPRSMPDAVPGDLVEGHLADELGTELL